MKALLKVKSSKGTGIIYSTGVKVSANSDSAFVLEILGKKINLNSLHGNLIVLNPSNGANCLVISENQVKEIFGIYVKGGAKLEVVAFADGTKIPTGESVQVNDFARVHGQPTKDALVAKITKKEVSPVLVERKYTNETVDSGCGFTMIDNKSNWDLVFEYEYDAIEMVDGGLKPQTKIKTNDVPALEIDN